MLLVMGQRERNPETEEEDKDDSVQRVLLPSTCQGSLLESAPSMSKQGGGLKWRFCLLRSTPSSARQ